MNRWMRTLIVTAAVAVGLGPVAAFAQYGTTTTTSTTAPPVTTPTAPPPTLPPVTTPTLPPAEVLGEVQDAFEDVVDDIDDLLDDLGVDLDDEDVDLSDLTDEQRETLTERVTEIIGDIGDIFGDDDAERQARIDALNSDDPEVDELKQELAERFSKIIAILVGLDAAGDDLEPLGDELDAFAEGTNDGPVTVSLTVPGLDGIVFFILESDPQFLGVAETDVDGEANLNAEIPDDLDPGTHTISATGTDEDGNPVVSQLEFEVAEPETEPAAAVSTPTDDGGNGFATVGILLGIAALGAAGIAVRRRGRAAAASTRGS